MLVSSDMPHCIAVVEPTFITVAKTVAATPTRTERLLGSTAANKLTFAPSPAEAHISLEYGERPAVLNANTR